MSYKHKIHISDEKPIDINEVPGYILRKQMRERIFYIFGISIWMGHLSFITRRILPRVSYFDGGSYWKLSFYWLKYIVEFSGGKKDKVLYREVSREELDEILRKV